MAFPSALPPAVGAIPPLMAGSGPTAPTAAPAPFKWVPPTLEMSADDVRLWWGRITADRATRELRSRRWKQYMASYLPTRNSDVIGSLKSNLHFRNCETKAAELWAQFPQLTLTPMEPLRNVPEVDATGQPVIGPDGKPKILDPYDVTALFREVLNKTLADANADLTIREAIFDYLQVSGVSPTIIHYQSDVKYPPEQAAPAAMPGSVLGLSGANDVGAAMPIVVNERWLWEHFSPDRLLIPSDFNSTRYDTAPYLAMEFSEPDTPQARKYYKLPDNWKPNATQDDRSVAPKETTAPNKTPLIKGVLVWLKAAFYDPNEPDRDVYYRLVLIEGMHDKAAIYEFSPYQEKDARGKLTYDSMIGNPIHPITLRVASDMAWIEPDAAFTDPLVQIKDKRIRNDEKLRQANLPRFFHAASLCDDFDKLVTADTGQGVPIADDLMRQFGQLVQPIPHLEKAEADREGDIALDTALTQTLGIGPGQAGSATQTKRSATENAIIANAVNVRMKKEQTQLKEAVLAGVRKMASLIQRYKTTPGYVQIIGQDGTARLQAFTQAHLAFRYAIEALPDSQLTIDQESRTKRVMDTVNFTAKSAFVDQLALMRLVFTENGYNAAQLVKPPPPPPPPKPDLPNISYAFKAQDLAIPEVRQILAVAYPQLAATFSQPPSPESLLASAAENAKVAPQPQHGGAADKVDLLDKHTSQHTGQQPGVHPLNPVAALPASPHLPVGTH